MVRPGGRGRRGEDEDPRPEEGEGANGSEQRENVGAEPVSVKEPGGREVHGEEALRRCPRATHSPLDAEQLLQWRDGCVRG